MTTTAKPRISPTMQIMIGLAVGLIFGYWISTHDPATRAWYASIIQPFSQIFIRMIRMIIAPARWSPASPGPDISRTSAAWACAR